MLFVMLKWSLGPAEALTLSFSLLSLTCAASELRDACYQAAWQCLLKEIEYKLHFLSFSCSLLESAVIIYAKVS